MAVLGVLDLWCCVLGMRSLPAVRLPCSVRKLLREIMVLNAACIRTYVVACHVC
ncbi:hypothetical protein P154DRAFT_521494 [Amniculicola lignicola CBS 123094]|uniref:Uncharacterized protein n=1 Tax=Amniculicola lignicola CBS 123094 TaxID=1392246 RepID=A0A6A5WLU8_9PLEO|nr:hypothetical protein P154DRAFT_521494 [Amniculicola lignicola CBS 123094]